MDVPDYCAHVSLVSFNNQLDESPIEIALAKFDKPIVYVFDIPVFEERKFALMLSDITSNKSRLCNLDLLSNRAQSKSVESVPPVRVVLDKEIWQKQFREYVHSTFANVSIAVRGERQKTFFRNCGFDKVTNVTKEFLPKESASVLHTHYSVFDYPCSAVEARTMVKCLRGS
jgi:hypothetical protein